MQDMIGTGHKVRESIKKINADCPLRFDEPMAGHCTFNTGGTADIYACPSSTSQLLSFLEWARSEGQPVFVLGGGANLLVSDRGIRGLVLDTSGLKTWNVQGTMVEAGAGLPVSEASVLAAELGLQGLEFIYAMPGSTGGAVYMNARCYDGEIADVLAEVDYLDANLEPRTMKPEASSFAYKDTPFMHNPWIILGARFSLKHGDRAGLWQRMKELEKDRRDKGHFRYPCAGSVFKNNRDFGQPTGKIIDALGLKGTACGGARIADFHGNIIINTGNASSSDIKSLIDLCITRVREAHGWELEPELVMAGDWQA